MPIRWRGRIAEVSADNGNTLHRTTGRDRTEALGQLRALLKALLGSVVNGEIVVQEPKVKEKKTDRLNRTEPWKR